MLYLLKQEDGSNFFYLISGKEYIVGRKNADITLANDQSISRQHAIIKVQSNSVTLTDCGSKYGTFHRGVKIEASNEIHLEDQDVIKFGVFQSIYKIEKVNVVTTGSGLSNPQKNALKKNLEFLGGTFLNNWDSSCSHLTIQEVMLTIKVLLALIDGKPFVTLEFWSEFVQNIKKNKPPPKVEDFKPKIAEVLLNASAMNTNPKRTVLFKGKTFVFPSDKIKSKMEDLILKTGGECISWERQPLTLTQVKDPEKNYIFIYSDEVKEMPESLKSIFEHLVKVGQRTIPVQEIAMAVMMCSCEKDCNPHFNRIQKVFFKKETDACSEMYPLAYETQSEDVMAQPKQEVIIPGSLDADLDSTWQPIQSLNNNREPFSVLNIPSTSNSTPSTSKRVMEDTLENPFKKAKLNETSTTKPQQTAVESKKRKADESLEPSPKKSSLKENPFAILRKRNKQLGSDNPFAGLRLKQEKVLDDNPFARTVEQSREGSQVEEISLKSEFAPSDTNTVLNGSNKSRCTNLSDIKWISKNSVKTEVIDIAEEFEEIYNKFRNTVIIEILPLPTRRTSLSDSVDGNVTAGNKKNFKKFKKVRPVRPQVSVIHTSVSQVANTTNQEVTIFADDEEDSQDAFPIRAPKRVNKSRRFNF